MALMNGAQEGWTKMQFDFGSASNQKLPRIDLFDIDENNRVMTVHKMIFKKHHENNVIIFLQQWMGSMLRVKMKIKLMMHTGSPGKSTRIYLIFDCMQLLTKMQTQIMSSIMN